MLMFTYFKEANNKYEINPILFICEILILYLRFIICMVVRSCSNEIHKWYFKVKHK